MYCPEESTAPFLLGPVFGGKGGGGGEKEEN